MSVERCHDCDKYIDTDFDAEHFDGHQEDRDRALFEELTGENPEDVLGPDWQAIMRDYLDEKQRKHTDEHEAELEDACSNEE